MLRCISPVAVAPVPQVLNMSHRGIFILGTMGPFPLGEKPTRHCSLKPKDSASPSSLLSYYLLTHTVPVPGNTLTNSWQAPSKSNCTTRAHHRHYWIVRKLER